MAEQKPIRHARNFKDLTGHKFARLTVISFSDISHGNARWQCQCDCGNITVVAGCALRRGNIKSCGCYARELTSARTATHGLSNTRAWDAWYNALQRCSNPSDCSYRNYGERGIVMCKEWAQSFEQFFKDMGECPDGLTLERTDNDGPYAPGNCKWATRKTQMRNRRNSP